MKARELMIGDWVMNTCNRKPEQVCEVREHIVMLEYNGLYDYDEIEPIPLTEEILEANGFELHEGEVNLFGVTTVPYYAIEGSPYIFCDGDPFAVWFEEEVTIKYVHQLQHLLRLCGLKKDIKLKERAYGK